MNVLVKLSAAVLFLFPLYSMNGQELKLTASYTGAERGSAAAGIVLRTKQVWFSGWLTAVPFLPWDKNSISVRPSVSPNSWACSVSPLPFVTAAAGNLKTRGITSRLKYPLVTAGTPLKKPAVPETGITILMPAGPEANPPPHSVAVSLGDGRMRFSIFITPPEQPSYTAAAENTETVSGIFDRQQEQDETEAAADTESFPVFTVLTVPFNAKAKGGIAVFAGAAPVSAKPSDAWFTAEPFFPTGTCIFGGAELAVRYAPFFLFASAGGIEHPLGGVRGYAKVQASVSFPFFSCEAAVSLTDRDYIGFSQRRHTDTVRTVLNPQIRVPFGDRKTELALGFLMRTACTQSGKPGEREKWTAGFGAESSVKTPEIDIRLHSSLSDCPLNTGTGRQAAGARFPGTFPVGTGPDTLFSVSAFVSGKAEKNECRVFWQAGAGFENHPFAGKRKPVWKAEAGAGISLPARVNADIKAVWTGKPEAGTHKLEAETGIKAVFPAGETVSELKGSFFYSRTFFPSGKPAKYRLTLSCTLTTLLPKTPGTVSQF